MAGVKPSSRKTIVLDFDGVIAQYKNGWTGVEPTEPPVPGAREAVEELIRLGYEVVVVSSRAYMGEHPGGEHAIVRWLDANGFPPLRVTSDKVPAVLYVDDRGFRFTGDWREVLEFVARGPCSMMPWERKTPEPW